MKCPHYKKGFKCKGEIDDSLIAIHMGSKGGSLSKRKLTAEDSEIMCQIRKLNAEKKEQGLPIYRITIEEFKEGKR